MNALVDVPGEAPPEGGVMLPPLEVRGRVDPRMMIRRIELRERTAQGDGGAECREENHR
ncbi:hypothetical protein [Streptomyces sp. NPDC058773]|uniref:hypothetical protein n=1 Tax=Streptomyces sp. NPDC058773 TaxID=3346632 RepID=UPI0036AE77E8